MMGQPTTNGAGRADTRDRKKRMRQIKAAFSDEWMHSSVVPRNQRVQLRVISVVRQLLSDQDVDLRPCLTIYFYLLYCTENSDPTRFKCLSRYL